MQFQDSLSLFCLLASPSLRMLSSNLAEVAALSFYEQTDYLCYLARRVAVLIFQLVQVRTHF